MLEPVDADYRPTLPGTPSHTVLLSNLASRVQPILRYDLGDSILQRPDPCPCGNPLPAIRVQGRSADVLSFTTERGERVFIPPLALELDHISGVELSQIVQTAPMRLRVRLRPAPGADPERMWGRLCVVGSRACSSSTGSIRSRSSALRSRLRNPAAESTAPSFRYLPRAPRPRRVEAMSGLGERCTHPTG